MSEIIGDLYSLPMLCEKGDAYIYSSDCRYSIRFDDSDTNCMEQQLAVSKAINSHDKLTEEKKMLRDFILSLQLSAGDDVKREDVLDKTK